MENTKQCFILLKQYGSKLTKQQYRTFKGQIKAGDFDGFRTGLFNLIKRRKMSKCQQDDQRKK